MTVFAHVGRFTGASPPTLVGIVDHGRIPVGGVGAHIMDTGGEALTSRLLHPWSPQVHLTCLYRNDILGRSTF